MKRIKLGDVCLSYDLKLGQIFKSGKISWHIDLIKIEFKKNGIGLTQN